MRRKQMQIIVNILLFVEYVICSIIIPSLLMDVKGEFSLSEQSIIKHIIGRTIKSLRIKRGLSQEDLAGECGVDRSYISMIEVGKNEPSVSKIFDLCKGLKIKPSSFFKLIEIEYEKRNDANPIK
ncbi:helix-turn-helix transcriptional regulator [Paenibacillus sp. M1]|uniref:Helix-turn-helix transcriptional regulator n=1 Tax=Paenibacillus haidiansis TaxID=1574488 RepID=A0ABU7VZJ7_9BACL